MVLFDDPSIPFDSPFYSFDGVYLGTSDDDSETIECWATTPSGAYIAHADRSEASPFRGFAVSWELNKPGAGSLEYFESNAIVAANPTMFDFGNLVWMKYRGRRLVWIVEQQTMKLDQSEGASGWYQVAGRGVLQLLGDRIIFPTGFDGTNQPKDWLLPLPVESYVTLVEQLFDFRTYWRLAETSGPMLDEGGEVVSGTVGGSPTRGVTGLLVGVANKAVQFNGTSWVDFGDVYIGDYFDFDFPGNTPFRMGVLVKPTSSSTTWRPIISKTDGTDTGWELRHSTTAVSFRRGADEVTAAALPMGKVTHVVVTFDGKNLILYRNGVPSDAVDSTASLAATAQPVRIGIRSNATSGGFVGVIDEAFVCQTTDVVDGLPDPADEIRDLYAVASQKQAHSQYRSFVDRPAGRMLRRLIAESNPRFATKIIVPTPEEDPDLDDLWTADFRFDNLLEVHDQVTTDLGDTWMDGLTLYYVLLLGTDLSETVIFEEGADIVRLEREQNDRDSISWVIAEGAGEGIAAKIKVWPTSPADGSRRREAYVDAKDARNSRLLRRKAKRAIAEAALLHSVGLDVTEARYRALVDYQVGDWVQVISPSRGLDDSLRVMAMYFAEVDERVRVAIDVNTHRSERLVALAERQRETAQSLKTGQRQPQGQSTLRGITGSGVFDSSTTMEVFISVPDRMTQVDECQVSVHFRQYFYQAAGGLTTETMPATHSVRFRVYKDGAAVHTETLIDDDVDIDLAGIVDGPGKFKIVLDSDAGQPQGGRLAADVSGHVLGTIGSD